MANSETSLSIEELFQPLGFTRLTRSARYDCQIAARIYKDGLRLQRLSNIEFDIVIRYRSITEKLKSVETRCTTPYGKNDECDQMGKHQDHFQLIIIYSLIEPIQYYDLTLLGSLDFLYIL